jgi:creatinine amidohydrolase
MPDEVRYHMMRPAQIVARRNACPVAYIPIGTIEWHGPHNPTGADSLQAESLAILCAQKGGGLAFPALYYGENRLAALVEADSLDKELIAKEMDLPPENFHPDAFPFTIREQMQSYHNLLVHILSQVETLGFKVGCLIAGHYPLIDFAVAAALHHNKRRYYYGTGNYKVFPNMLAFAFMDAVMLRGNLKYPKPGDHAGIWETSHLMHSHPETVDLSKLPPKGEKIIGVSMNNPQDSTAAFGKETLEAAAEVAIKETRHRLENRDAYLRHGGSQDLGLWQK